MTSSDIIVIKGNIKGTLLRCSRYGLVLLAESHGGYMHRHTSEGLEVYIPLEPGKLPSHFVCNVDEPLLLRLKRWRNKKRVRHSG